MRTERIVLSAGLALLVLGAMLAVRGVAHVATRSGPLPALPDRGALQRVGLAFPQTELTRCLPLAAKMGIRT